jgi:4-carboxymuconolactone decarboxylase
MRTILLSLASSSLLAAVWAQTTPATTAAVAANAGLAISHSSSRQTIAGPPKFFTGTVQVQQLFPEEPPSRATGGLVTFAPGARSAWHTHPLGQILYITAGIGRVQMEGGPIQEVRAGDVVRIPPHVKHWHGAAPDSPMTHIAIQESKDGDVVNWLEPVTDQQYNGGK